MLEVTGFGRIASDIDLKHSKDGKHLYTNFLFASHRRVNKKQETTFIRCVAFDAMATLLNNFFSKGDRVILKGELISDDYNGSKYVFKLQVKNFEFVETIADHNKNKMNHMSKEARVK